MKFKYREYETGLRLFVVPKEDTQAVTVMVLVGVGSNNEKDSERGLAHFLEHMCFKGTTRRPKSLDIIGELDSLGAQYNAFTGKEQTGYYVKSRKEDVGRVIDVISDVYLNSTFPEVEIEKEKGVVFEEIRMNNDEPRSVVYERYLETIHGDQPAGKSITGTIKSVRNISQDQIIDFHKRFYNGKNTVIVVSGSLDTKEIYKLIEEKFAPILSGRTAPRVATKTKQTDPRVAVVHRSTDQAHLLLGFRAVSSSHKDSVALQVLSTVLGGSMSSRLFVKLREEMGVAYYVGSQPELYKDYGMLTLYTGVDKKRVKSVLSVLLEEVNKLKTDLVWLGELERAQQYLLGHLALDLESSNFMASFLGSQAIRREEVLTPDAYAKKIKDVTAEDIQRVAKYIFTKNKLNFAIIGPYKSSNQFSGIIEGSNI